MSQDIKLAEPAQALPRGAGLSQRKDVVAVCALTRRRPDGITRMLQSWAAMERPAGADIIFVIVENDDTSSCASQIASFEASVSEPVRHVLFSEHGIPQARNRALDEAIALKADYMTFVDDDEAVLKNWLVELYELSKRRGLDLAGGPLLPRATGALNFWQTGGHEAMRDTLDRTNSHRLAEASRDKDGHFNVYTNNWIIHVPRVVAVGLRFNHALVDTGGSDTRFCKDARSLGLRSGWIGSAYVEDWLAPSRYSPGYIMKRGMSQAANNYHYKPQPIGRLLFRLFGKVVNVLLSVPGLLFGRRGAARMVRRLRSAAMVTGELRAAFGYRSQLYQDPGPNA